MKGVFCIITVLVFGGFFSIGVQSDLSVEQTNIKEPKNVTPGEFKESKCKGLGIRFENGYFKVIPAPKDLPASDMTFIAWIRVRDTEKINTIYSTSTANGAKQVLEVRPSANGRINGFLKWTVKTDKTNTVFSIDSEDNIPSGIWVHVVAKYDGKQGRAYLFVNGIKLTKEKSVAKSEKLPWGKDIVIGGLTDEAGKVTFVYTGGLMGIRFVQKPLTDAEIKSEYDSCNPLEGEEPFLVTVCTDDKLIAGTSSSVYIKVYGKNGQFGEIKIGDKFKSGCSKAITIYGPSVGIIEKISVRKADVPKLVVEKTWVLNKIMISAEKMPTIGEKYTFTCTGCKFSKKEQLQRFIKATQEVNGGWSAWSDWSGCGSGLCGGDKKVRTRACTNPEPFAGGKNCKAKDDAIRIFESEATPCPVDGGWGAWSSWSDCDKLCGGSIVKRTRICDNPAPATSGKPCVGPDSETQQDCTELCEDWPVNGGWAEWGQWSACAKTCGGSTVTRKRTCTKPAPLRGGLPCEGDGTETARDCTNPCPVDGKWTDWGPWGDCSTTCGPGKQTSERNCTKPSPVFNGKPCAGESKKVQSCKLVDCPNAVNGKWGKWGPWTTCSETEFCNLGKKTRTRKCDSPAPSKGGDLCSGLNTEEEICPKDKCKPVNGDSIQVKPTSFIGESCKAKTAYYANPKRGTKAKEIPASISTKYLKGISDVINDSYFSKTTEKQDGVDVTKFCFQPGTVALPSKAIDKVFPEYKSAPGLPGFEKPAATDNLPGLSVSLKSDGSMLGVEVSLSDSEKYSPMSEVELENIRFVFREKPNKKEIVAYGQHKVVGNIFNVEVVPGPIMVGKSDGKTDLGEVYRELSASVDVVAGVAQKETATTFKDLFFKHLTILGLSKLTLTALTEGATVHGIETIRRISGTVTSDSKDMFNAEILKKGKFLAVGVTADKVTLKNILDKLLVKLKKSPSLFEFFGEMVDSSIGIAYSPVHFAIDPQTTFQKEPLKSGFSEYIRNGVFFAIKASLPQKCHFKMCSLTKAVVGKEGALLFTANIRGDGMDFIAAILNRKITDKLKFSKLELYIKIAYAPPSVTFVFNIELAVTITSGEVYVDNILQPAKELIFNALMDIASTADAAITLVANGVWKKAFGIPYLTLAHFYISIAFSMVTLGMPSKVAFGGDIQLGKDCYAEKDFEKDGLCIKGTTDISISPDPKQQYIYGELSAVTIGKIFRMLGSKLELPERIAESGFSKKVVVSYALVSQTLTFLQTPRTIKKGLFIQGELNLLGIAIETEIVLNENGIVLQVELSPIDLFGKVKLLRSLKEKTKGPIFYMRATRSPLSAEICLQGAAKIFGFEMEIKFHFRPRFIEAQAKFTIPIGKTHTLGADLEVKGTYGKTLKETGFSAKITITTGKKEIEDETNKETKARISKADIMLMAAKDVLFKEKKKCKELVSTFCKECKAIECAKVKESCEEALDTFSNYIGGVADRFGVWFTGLARRVAATFKTKRERRSAEFFPGRAQLMTRLRRKRYVGRFMCKQIAPQICKKSRTFCEATCKLPQHITKGVCKGLDLAHKNLYKAEETYYWLKKVVPKYFVQIHEISFELALSPSLLSKVAASVDFTFMNVRRKLSAELSLQDIVDIGKTIANKIIEIFRHLIPARFTEPSYDRPSNVVDFRIGGPFRIVNSANKQCVKSSDKNVGSSLGTGLCTNKDTLWVYTLTGELMNMESEHCLGFVGTGKDQKVTQQQCQIGAENQHFTCDNRRIHPPGSTTSCLVQKGNTVAMGTCTEPPQEMTKEFVIPKEEEWGVDKFQSVCDNYVTDLAYKKRAAEQSSSFSKNELDQQELSEIDPKEKEIILTKVGPELAVDGNMDFNLAGGSCAHSALSQDPWWKVDLQAEHVITDVSIQTGAEGVKVDALENFEIRVGIKSDFQSNPMCGNRVKSIHVGELWTSTCSPPIPGKIVSIQSFGKTRMTLCEVAVYSRQDNQGMCSSEIKRKRDELANVSRRDRILQTPRKTYGFYY